MDAAIHRDYLIGIVITSSAQGKMPSVGMDYGAGKSTLAMNMAELYYGDWGRVFENMVYFPYHVELFFRTRVGRTPILLWDDMQLTVGKDKAQDRYIRRLAYRLTTARPHLAVLIGTCPHLGTLHKSFREFFTFEVKVPERGRYEVQQLKRWSPFGDPLNVRVTMRYKGEAVFGPLPPDVQMRYDAWRAEMNGMYDEGYGDLCLAKFEDVLAEEDRELLARIVRKGSMRREHIIRSMASEKSAPFKKLKACGLVEQFGDEVVPTRAAYMVAKALEAP